MKRGDIVTVALQGNFGKPRPALIIQSDIFNDLHATITVALISSKIISAPLFRITLEPNAENGLKTICQVQIDKVMTIQREKIGATFGYLDSDTMIRVHRALIVWMGIA